MMLLSHCCCYAVLLPCTICCASWVAGAAAERLLWAPAALHLLLLDCWNHKADFCTSFILWPHPCRA